MAKQTKQNASTTKSKSGNANQPKSSGTKATNATKACTEKSCR